MSVAVSTLVFPIEEIDQRICLHDIRWQGYEALLAMRGEQSGT